MSACDTLNPLTTSTAAIYLMLLRTYDSSLLRFVWRILWRPCIIYSQAFFFFWKVTRFLPILIKSYMKLKRESITSDTASSCFQEEPLKISVAFNHMFKSYVGIMVRFTIFMVRHRILQTGYHCNFRVFIAKYILWLDFK